MKQGEAKAFVLGVGSAVLREQSNDARYPLPKLIIMQPYCAGYEDVPTTPAHSMTLHHDEVRALYEILKEYYDGLTNTL